MALKIVGYIVALLGVLGLAVATISPLRASLALPEGIAGNTLTVISLLIVIVGAALIYLTGNKKKKEEVPIYEGKKLVGYRRV